jgi:hypothetical protein
MGGVFQMSMLKVYLKFKDEPIERWSASIGEESVLLLEYIKGMKKDKNLEYFKVIRGE